MLRFRQASVAVATVVLPMVLAGGTTASLSASSTPSDTATRSASDAGMIPPEELRGRILFGRAGGEWGHATIFTADADGSNDQRIGGVLADKTTCCPGTVATIFPVAPANELCVVRADGSDLTCIIDTEDHKIWTDRTETE